MYSCLHMKRRSMIDASAENRKYTSKQFPYISNTHSRASSISGDPDDDIFLYYSMRSCRRMRPFKWVVWQCVDGKDAVLCICS